MSNSEKRFTGVQKCRHCRNSAPMEIVATHSQVEQREEKTGMLWEAGPVYELLRCAACSDVTLRSVVWMDGW